MFFVCLCVYIVDYTDRFSYVGPSLHLWNEAYLFMVDDIFYVFLDSVFKNFTEYFGINVYGRNWFVIFFESLCRLDIRVTVALLNKNVASISILWHNLRIIGISSFLKVWQNSVLKPTSPGPYLVVRLLITVSVFQEVLGLLKLFV